jgi:hypothetical protein
MAEMRDQNLGVSQSLRARLHPLPNGRYSVILDGRLLVDQSRDPECDAARALLAMGHTGRLHMLDGKTGRPRTIIDIEKAAKVTTKEGRHGPYFAKLTAPDRASSPETSRKLLKAVCDSPGESPRGRSRKRRFRIGEHTRRKLADLKPYVSKRVSSRVDGP